MMYIMIFFIPALISLEIKDKYFKSKLSIKDYIFLYAKYNILINIILFFVLYIYFGNDLTNIRHAMDTVSFVFKSLVIVLISSFFVPVIVEYIDKNVNLKIDIKEKNEKYEKKRNKKKNN